MKKISGKFDAQEAIIYTLNMQEVAKYRICQFQSSSHELSEGFGRSSKFDTYLVNKLFIQIDKKSPMNIFAYHTRLYLTE